MSTIVYINDEGIENHEELIERVKLVKPHFSLNQIERQVNWLSTTNLLN
jgi:hypothetical protein